MLNEMKLIKNKREFEILLNKEKDIKGKLENIETKYENNKQKILNKEKLINYLENVFQLLQNKDKKLRDALKKMTAGVLTGIGVVMLLAITITYLFPSIEAIIINFAIAVLGAIMIEKICFDGYFMDTENIYRLMRMYKEESLQKSIRFEREILRGLKLENEELKILLNNLDAELAFFKGELKRVNAEFLDLIEVNESQIKYDNDIGTRILKPKKD